MTLKNVSLRELEVISCLLHGKTAKSTAILLGVSPHTVNAHSYNIKRKLGLSSKDAIVSFLENTTYKSYLQSLYSEILNSNETTKVLSNLKLEPKSFFIKIHFSNQHTKEALLNRLPQHLAAVGIAEKIEHIKISTNDNSIFFEHGSRNNVINIKIQESENSPMSYTKVLLDILKNISPNVNFSNLIKLEKPFNRALNQRNNSINYIKKSYVPILILILGGIIFHYLLPFESKISENKELFSWNLPQKREHHIKRTKLIQKVRKIFSLNHPRSIVTLYGLGGSGKTTLAKYFVNHSTGKKYSFKAWFPSESHEILKGSYLELGDRERLFHKDMSDKVKIKTVKNWISHSGGLIVYDNAKNLESLDEFLPSKGNIIITSRNYKFPNTIEVKAMEDKESFELLNKLIPDKLKSGFFYIKNIKKISADLGHLPLALSQAGSYISENMMKLERFIDLYKTNRDNLLIEETLPAGDVHEPVFITWKMNVKSIKNNKKAMDILSFISYCYPEDMPKKILLYYIGGKGEEISLNKSITLLRKHSLISISEETISIHRLLHDWISSNHKKSEKKMILKRAVKVIKGNYPKSSNTQDDIFFARKLIPHCESILGHLTSQADKADILQVLGKLNHHLGYDKKSKEYFSKLLEIQKKKYMVMKAGKFLRHFVVLV